MRQRAELRQRQKQEFNARFMSAVRLLQMPAPQLAEEIREVLDSNPMLEEVEPQQLSTSCPNIVSASHGDSSEFDSDQYLEYAAFTRQSLTLKEHLKNQLYASGLPQHQYFIADAVISSIDERGYLVEPVEDIADYLSKAKPVSEGDVERVLNVIQGFDPAGVAARNLQECLLLQLHLSESAAMVTAREIVERCLDELSRMEISRIADHLCCSLPEVEDAVELIRSLNPLPGNDYGTSAEIIIPDLIVSRAGAQWHVELNDEVLPKLRISKTFCSILEQKPDSDSVRFLKQNLGRANAFLHDLSQRHQTILRVAQEIVRRQQPFFKFGAQCLRPLTLREIAEALDLHESTVSRACSGKYIMTPDSTFEVKNLFSYRIRNRFGRDESTTSIKYRLRQVVKQENPRSPLSDRQITENLRSIGMEISRRTVAKYRSELRIPTQRQRKAIAMSKMENEVI